MAKHEKNKGKNEKVCPECKGKKQILEKYKTGVRPLQTCSACLGTGKN